LGLEILPDSGFQYSCIFVKHYSDRLNLTMTTKHTFDIINFKNTLLEVDSESVVNFHEMPIQQDSALLKNESQASHSKETIVTTQKDTLGLVSNQKLVKSDSTLSDSSLFPVDTILSQVDSSQYTIAVEQPRFGGKEISRFENINIGNDWVVGVILFAFFLIASVKFLFGKYLSKLTDSIFNSNTANSLFLEKNISMIKGSLMMNLLFVINISLFAVNVMDYFDIHIRQSNDLKQFMLVFFMVLVLYVGKYALIKGLGYVFKGKNESKEYLFTIFLYNKNLGLFLFPIIIALPFVQVNAVVSLINIGILMIFFFFFLRISRGVKILIRKHVSIFYMILYLCALEILPLLMIYKLLVV